MIYDARSMFQLTSLQFEKIEDSLGQSSMRRVLAAAAMRWQQDLGTVEREFSGCVLQARVLGFLNDTDLGDYLDIVRAHGTDFHAQSWAAPFFTKIPVDHPSGTLMYLQALAARRA